jgi:uracil-DNA glycosylase
MSLSAPCIRPSGPLNARVAIIGEAPGETEEQLGVPFVGNAGRLLDSCLKQAGIERSHCYLTNVLKTRPPQNRLEAFCVPKSHENAIRTMPSLLKGEYLHSDFQSEIGELYRELNDLRPNLIIACGNTAAWAVLKQTGISKIRGTIVPAWFTIANRPVKVLPTYHPSAIFKMWHNRPVLVADLIKANHEKDFPEIVRPARDIIINPALGDIAVFYEQARRFSKLLAVDIETQNGQITCIGFATSSKLAIVIPFVDHRKPNKHYWQSESDEVSALQWTARFLALPQPKIFQNGLFDLQYLRAYKLRVTNCLHDTMLMHHAMHPEMLKGLGFMGSIYTNEPAWKLMRNKGEEVLKRDE